MRNLEGSPHLESANLVEIKAVTQPARINEFTLNVNITRPKEEIDEKALKGPGKPAAKKK
jgi:hypothetical protein